LFSTFTPSVIPTEQISHVWFCSSRNTMHNGFAHHYTGWSQDNTIVQGRI
jgi:hypothetical protein